MQQFIQMVTSAFGTSEQVARTVTGGLLDVIAKNAPTAEVGTLLNRLPGAAELLNAFRAAPPPPPAPEPDPGIVGTLSGAASAVLGAGSSVLGAGSSVLGSGAAGLSSLATLFSRTGIDVSKVPQLVAMFAQWAAQHAGGDVVQRSLGALPGAATILATLGSLGVPGMPAGRRQP
jgi:hypothetical protein